MFFEVYIILMYYKMLQEKIQNLRGVDNIHKIK